MPKRQINPWYKYSCIPVYIGNFKNYVPDPSEKASESNFLLTDYVTPSEKHAGHNPGFKVFRTSPQSRQGDYHHYSYGKSKKALRPVVTEEQDLEWFEHEYTNRADRKNWVKA